MWSHEHEAPHQRSKGGSRFNTPQNSIFLCPLEIRRSQQTTARARSAQGFVAPVELFGFELGEKLAVTVLRSRVHLSPLEASFSLL